MGHGTKGKFMAQTSCEFAGLHAVLFILQSESTVPKFSTHYSVHSTVFVLFQRRIVKVGDSLFNLSTNKQPRYSFFLKIVFHLLWFVCVSSLEWEVDPVHVWSAGLQSAQSAGVKNLWAAHANPWWSPGTLAHCCRWQNCCQTDLLHMLMLNPCINSNCA